MKGEIVIRYPNLPEHIAARAHVDLTTTPEGIVFEFTPSVNRFTIRASDLVFLCAEVQQHEQQKVTPLEPGQGARGLHRPGRIGSVTPATENAMGKFNSDWIERNWFYELVGGAGSAPRYTQYARPLIVCLCGSTRFYEAFQRANYDETMAGRIVLSVGHYPHSPQQAHGESVGCTPEQKTQLDELHKRKIDLADQVLILNVGGYIGESTRSELEYARKAGKTIRFLEEPGA